MGAKGRVFALAFKVTVVRRLMAGESVSATARELGIRRKVRYEWKSRYRQLGEAGLRPIGRPKKEVPLGPPAPEVLASRNDLQTARERIGGLERKVGQQELELDFFVAALRRIRAAKNAEQLSAN